MAVGTQTAMSNGIPLKLVAVGDHLCGKTCVLIRYATGTFPQTCTPSVCDNYARDVTDAWSNERFTLHPWDTSAMLLVDFFRHIAYFDTNVFLVCVALDDEDGLQRAQDKWVPEIQQHCPSTPYILVACKSDLRPSAYNTEKEIRKMARRLKCEYILTSALTGQGITELFSYAVSLGAWHIQCFEKGQPLHKFVRLKNKTPKPQLKPDICAATFIKVENSTFVDDMRNLMEDESSADVIFLVEGTNFIFAHRIFLCTSSECFCDIFGASWRQRKNSSSSDITQLHRVCVTDRTKDGITDIHEEVESGTGIKRPVIRLVDEIRSTSFRLALHFLYTGTLNVDEAPDTIEKLRKVAELFSFIELETHCSHLGKEGIPISSETTGQHGKILFNNRHVLSDVAFRIEGETIEAHKAILSARCEVMGAMLGQNFLEGHLKKHSPIPLLDVGRKEFLVFLEYLYTDHAPVRDCDPVELLKLSDRFCLPRLRSLCELHIAEDVEQEWEQRGKRMEWDIFGLVNIAQVFNAPQLASWCLQFISGYYSDFSKMKGFSDLGEENLKILKENMPYNDKNKNCSVKCSLL